MLKIETAQNFEVSGAPICAILKKPIGLFEGADRVEMSCEVWIERQSFTFHQADQLLELPLVPAGKPRYRL